VTIEILDSSGEVIRTIKKTPEPGLNRVTWRLRRKGVRFPNQPKPKPDADEPGGPPVIPGTYTVQISNGDHTGSTEVNVKLDPRIEISESDMKARNAMYDQLMARVEVTTEAMDRLREAKEIIGAISKQLKDRKDDMAKDVKKKGKVVGDSIKTLMEFVQSNRDVQGIRRDPSVVVSKIRQASSYLGAWHATMDETERIAIKHAEASMQEALQKINQFFQKEWAKYQAAVNTAKVTFFKEYKPLSMDLK
jgi:hypothetical protein